MHRRPRDARFETIYLVDAHVGPGRSLTGGAAQQCFAEVLGGALARHSVELFGVAVAPDGYQMLARALDDRLSAFVRDVQSGVARGLNDLRGVRGSLWAGRVGYHSMRSHCESVTTLVDLLVDPVRRGAVDHPADDGLLNSYVSLVEGRRELPHTVLPYHGAMSDAGLAHRLGAAIDARLAAARAWSRAG